jgi:hypothetical protein
MAKAVTIADPPRIARQRTPRAVFDDTDVTSLVCVASG